VRAQSFPLDEGFVDQPVLWYTLLKKGDITVMKRIEVIKEGTFSDKGMQKLLVHDSPYFRVLNFNFKSGQELGIHSHDVEGQLSIVVLEGEGEFLGKDGLTLPANTGDVLISDIREPHGILAISDMRVIVTIAPPV
jgi:quercetin dioxygenase-like cupin family protein